MIVQVPSGVFLARHLDPRQLSMSLNQGRSESENGESDGEFVEHRKREDDLVGWFVVRVVEIRRWMCSLKVENERCLKREEMIVWVLVV